LVIGSDEHQTQIVIRLLVNQIRLSISGIIFPHAFFCAFTVDIYGHLAPEGNKGAVDRLDDATTRNPGATKKEKDLTSVG